MGIHLAVIGRAASDVAMDHGPNGANLALSFRKFRISYADILTLSGGKGEGSKTSNARLTAHYIEGIGAVASGQHRMMDVEFGTSKCRINGSTRDCSQETTSRTLSTVVALAYVQVAMG
jgi:hypothetical protein